ncbi:retron Ec48 family effector membrane protein, partial [Vibrio splendidus]
MIKALWFGVYFFALYAIIVAGTLVISIVTEFISNDQLSFGFCLTKKCISVVSEHFGDTFDLYKTLFYMIVPLAGLFAGIVGLNTYKLAVSNSVMNNHVSNFKLFCDFIDRELDKRKLINSDDVDYFTMYLFVFPKSKYGNFND